MDTFKGILGTLIIALIVVVVYDVIKNKISKTSITSEK